MSLTIERVGAQGDGLARGPSGKLLFVPLTLAGEQVTAIPEGDRALVTDWQVTSADRIDPICPHYAACGGCSLQHWQAEPYLDWKAQLVREALSREGLETDIRPAFASRPGTRRRIGLHVRATKAGVEVGFKARRSWSLVPIESCSVADPRLVERLDLFRRLGACLLEHPKSAPILHVTLTETGLDVEISGVERKSGGLSADARMRLAEIAAEADLARISLAGEILYQARSAMVRFGRTPVALPTGAFLQACPEAEAFMAETMMQALSGVSRAADLFCGAGTFTFRLAEKATVLAADSAEGAVSALKSAIGLTPGLKTIRAEARDLFRRPVIAEEMKGIEAIVFDPPRAGAEAQTPEIARSSASVVVGISCNPATFARDARTLTDAGFRLETVTPADQFVWSAHVEMVGVFRR